MDSTSAGSVGRVDWSALGKVTGTRPLVSKYGMARYSPMEWKQANNDIVQTIPSAAKLDHDSKSTMQQIASACDKEQRDNTLKLRQRAADITSKHNIVRQYCEDLKEEVEQMAQYKLMIRKALESLGVVEGINHECLEIRKNRFTEDLVRDEVEEELLREKALCQEIRQLYMVALNEFDNQYRTIRGCYQEIHSIWSDQKETLDQEAENIGLKSSSDQISFYNGIGRLEPNMSSLEIWEQYMDEVLGHIKATIDSSRALRKRIKSPILCGSARDLKEQEEKVTVAFMRRIDEVDNAKQGLESQLNSVLNEIAHAEDLNNSLDNLGRKVDFNLKVVQTRLENRRHRPGAENCRDKPQMGLMKELKVVNERVSGLYDQSGKINNALEELYNIRKNLERQVHVKRHSLALDQQRCMLYRSRFPDAGSLMGY